MNQVYVTDHSSACSLEVSLIGLLVFSASSLSYWRFPNLPSVPLLFLKDKACFLKSAICCGLKSATVLYPGMGMAKAHSAAL